MTDVRFPPESTRDRLRRLDLFRGLDDAALDRLAGLSRIVHAPKKRVLFEEGDRYRGMYVVLDGIVVVYKISRDGRMLILHVCRAGDVVAEVPMFEDEDAGYPGYAKATRDSELLFLPRDRFVPFLKEHAGVEWEMLRGLAARLKDVSLRLEGVTLREVASRLARYLVRETEAAGQSDAPQPELELPLAKNTIASYLGTAHETLSRTLAKLVRDGVITVDGPRITILDVEKLKRLV